MHQTCKQCLEMSGPLFRIEKSLLRWRTMWSECPEKEWRGNCYRKPQNFIKDHATWLHLQPDFVASWYRTCRAVPSPRGVGFGQLSLPKQSSKTPQIETWNTINKQRFWQFLECQAPPQKREAPLLRTFWRRFCCRSIRNCWKSSNASRPKTAAAATSLGGNASFEILNE